MTWRRRCPDNLVRHSLHYPRPSRWPPAARRSSLWLAAFCPSLFTPPRAPEPRQEPERPAGGHQSGRRLAMTRCQSRRRASIRAACSAATWPRRAGARATQVAAAKGVFEESATPRCDPISEPLSAAASCPGTVHVFPVPRPSGFLAGARACPRRSHVWHKLRRPGRTEAIRQRWADRRDSPSATRTPHPLGAIVFAKGKPLINDRKRS